MEQALSGEVTPAEKAPTLGFWAKLGNIFVSPTNTFEAIKISPSWFTPLVIYILILFVVGIIAMPSTMDSIKTDTMTVYSAIPNMTEESLNQVQQQLEQQSEMSFSNIARGTPFLLIRFIPFFIVVSILFLFGTVFYGGDGKYKTIMSLVAWTYPIWALGAIVELPLKIIKHSHSASLSLAVLVPADPLNSTFYLLKNIGFFNIWAIAVLGLGFSTVYGFSKVKGLVTVFALWIVWVIINSQIPILNFYLSLLQLS
jgi:hypothetical protein